MNNYLNLFDCCSFYPWCVSLTLCMGCNLLFYVYFDIEHKKNSLYFALFCTVNIKTYPNTDVCGNKDTRFTH